MWKASLMVMRRMLLRNDGIAAKGRSVGLIRWTDGSSALPALRGGVDWEASFGLYGAAAGGE